jgi:hypothetical protein
MTEKKRTNSKALGNNYEREVAKKLSLWITNNENDDVVWRDLGSGSRGTVRAKQGKNTTRHGDFVPTDLNYKWLFDLFCIDSKSYKEWNPLFINEKNMKSNSILNQWIKVCQESQGKIPMMICHIRDRKTPEFVIVPKDILFPDSYQYPNMMEYTFNSKEITNCYLIILDDFFKIDARQLYDTNL